MILLFPPLPELLGGCRGCEHWYRLSSSSPVLWSHHHQPVLCQNRVRAGFPSWSETRRQVSPRAGFQGTLQCSYWAFGSRGSQPTPLEKRDYCVCAQQHKASRAEQGYRTSRFREENCPSFSCWGSEQQVRSQREPMAKIQVEMSLRACSLRAHKGNQLPSLRFN